MRTWRRWTARGSAPFSRALRRLRAVALLLVAGLLWLTAAADAPATLAPGIADSAEVQAELRQIEAYLNSIRTLRAQFTQQSSAGETAQGQLFLSRPGKMRIEYRPPVPVLVVADGTFLIYYDRSLEQVSYVPLGSTPASILLDPEISLTDPNLLISDLVRTDARTTIGIVRRDNPGEGSIALSFRRAPLALDEWIVTDPQGVATRVTLVDPQVNVPLDSALFRFEDPRKRGPNAP